jgi:membrane protease YdiL (CAAX protease family)
MTMRPTGSDTLHPAVAIGTAVLGVVLMIGAGLSLAPLLGRAGLEARDVLRAQIAIGSALLALPTLLVVPALRGASWRSTLALGSLPRRELGLSILLGGALWIGSIGLMELQATAWPPSPEYLEAFRVIHRALAPDGPFDALVSVAVIALAPGVGEELVMRGVLLPSLARRLGPALAVYISAVAFAVIHFDPYRLLFTLVIGLVLGALRLRSGSLWPPIIAHVTLNTLTFLIAPLVDDPSQTTYTPQPLLGVVALLFGAAVALPLLRTFRASVDSSRGPA